MNKNQWSLLANTQKDIIRIIQTIDQKTHTQQDFTSLLALKQIHQKENYPKIVDLLKVLNSKSRRKEQDGTNLCGCCYQQLAANKYWCRICGLTTCRKCLVRERQLKDQTKAFFCQKCDIEYLKAMSGFDHYNQIDKLQQTLGRLIQEQQTLQELVVDQRKKQMGEGESPSQLASNEINKQKITEQNKVLKVRCSQLFKKVEFGKTISRDLRRKLKGLKKQQGESFGTVSNNQSEGMLEQRDELNISIDHNRQSILTANSQMPQDIDFKKKCTCDIY